MGVDVSRRALYRGLFRRTLLGTILLVSAHVFLPTRLNATSVVALIDHANHRLVIAADCRVNRDTGPASACKIIQDGNCTAAMAGLYEQGNSNFHLREYVQLACREPGDLRSKADAFLRISRRLFEKAVIAMRKRDPADFAETIANKPTEVIFAGVQDGELGLIVRGLVADPAGKVSVERFESTAPSYARIGYFVGLNGHIRSYIKSHPQWAKEDFAKLAPRFVELEVEAHPDLAGLPISVIQIEENGRAIWLANGICSFR